MLNPFIWLFVNFDSGELMRAHISTLIPRMIRAGMKVHNCRFRVIAAGIDSKNRIISIATNRPRFQNRGLHAEERIMYSSPRSLVKILILRIGAKGDLLPIHPCRLCQKQADKRKIIIEPIGDKVNGYY